MPCRSHTGNQKMKKQNKKRVTRGMAVVVAVSALSFGAFSYFTDYAQSNVTATAGTLTVTATNVTNDLTDGLTILNPGDSNPFQFTINNTGSKSADIKAVITVTAKQAFTAEDHEYKITDKTGNELKGVLSTDKKSITYTIDDVVLNGSVETESGVTKTSHVYDYQFVMDQDAKNIWQGAEVDVKMEAFAKQHRNTSGLGNDWTSIVEKN